jgi:hypothetical protein
MTTRDMMGTRVSNGSCPQRCKAGDDPQRGNRMYDITTHLVMILKEGIGWGTSIITRLYIYMSEKGHMTRGNVNNIT